MTDTLSVKVLRSTGPDAPATFQAFVVPCASRMSVLDVLTHIQSDHDSTLGFRYSCRAGMCGTCSMRVNGKNRWTCRTPAEPFRKQGLTLEPLPNYPVIRDLAVDMTPFFENYRKMLPQFVPQNPTREGFARIRPDSKERREINPHIECITCGNCFGSCSLVGANPDYLGPAALNRAFTANCDSRDGATAERLNRLNSHDGVWGCHTQFNCTDACPMGISPTRAIQKLKRQQVRHALRRFF